uniref:Uncharacterized protein n=1 Tax=Knipowitschia caucasica TaxID=637954 RepID=A0AAV2IYW2_KNICA
MTEELDWIPVLLCPKYKHVRGEIILKITDFTTSKMSYRRERNVREVYEDRFIGERPGPYPRGGGSAERRGPYRPEEEYGRSGYEAGPRFFPNGGGPRNYHADTVHFPAERRAGPASRRVRE